MDFELIDYLPNTSTEPQMIIPSWVIEIIKVMSCRVVSSLAREGGALAEWRKEAAICKVSMWMMLCCVFNLNGMISLIENDIENRIDLLGYLLERVASVVIHKYIIRNCKNSQKI